ncbi:MAG: porin family protein [Myxococcota bacterium]|nr:porin family protein [Myxococcota bacterium]
MRNVLGCSLLAVSLPLTAIAQPPPPPPPLPSGGSMVTAPAEPLMRLDAGLIIGFPQGDFDGADTSLGIHLQFGYTVAPNISVFAGLRYIPVQYADAPEGFSLTHYDFNAGARYSRPVSPTMKLFGEAHLEFATISVDTPGGSESESGLGIGLRAGAIFAVTPSIGIGASLGYSTASIEDGDDAWLTLDGFASFGF